MQIATWVVFPPNRIYKLNKNDKVTEGRTSLEELVFVSNLCSLMGIIVVRKGIGIRKRQTGMMRQTGIVRVEGIQVGRLFHWFVSVRIFYSPRAISDYCNLTNQTQLNLTGKTWVDR